MRLTWYFSEEIGSILHLLIFNLFYHASLMNRRHIILIALLFALGAGFYCLSYAPSSYVWNGDAEALRRITPSLRTILIVKLVLLLGFCLLGLQALSIQSQRQRVGALLLLLSGWGVLEILDQHYLSAAYYTIWKYEVVTEEWAQDQPVITSKLLPLFVRDVQSAAESTDTRAKLALALGEAHTQAAYPVLKTIVEDPHQNPYLQFHCLKALRLLQPQRFSTVLAASPSDSAIALYRKYEPSKL